MGRGLSMCEDPNCLYESKKIITKELKLKIQGVPHGARRPLLRTEFMIKYQISRQNKWHSSCNIITWKGDEK